MAIGGALSVGLIGLKAFIIQLQDPGHRQHVAGLAAQTWVEP